MARAIWKYTIGFLQGGFGEFDIPDPGFITAVGNEGPDVVVFWAEVDPSPRARTSQRSFQIHGTGHPIPEGQVYVGTTQTVITTDSPRGHNHRSGPVWHLYEVPRA